MDKEKNKEKKSEKIADRKIKLEAKGVGVAVGDSSSGDKDKIEIVKNVSFEAQSGDLIGICGPNGAGKSTLLRALSTLIASSGSILINSKNIHDYKRNELSKILSFMHQDTLMPFSFTVEDVVSMGRFPYHGYFSEISEKDRKIIRDSMDLAGCYEYGDKYVTSLSGGERQRVMLARILAQDTPLIFLDEPTSAQDIKHAQETMALLRDLAREGRTIITVLHDLTLAAKYCNKTALMYEGQMVAFGDPEEVFHHGHLEYVFHIRTGTFTNPAGEWDYYTL